MMSYLLECRGIAYKIGTDVLLEDIDFTLSPGQGVLIFSESQRAASSFLQICSTLIRPTEGKLFIEGKEVDYDDQEELLDLKRKLAFVDKKSTLIQNLSVLENIALASIYHGNKSLESIQIQLDPIIEMFGLREVLYLRPAELDPSAKSRVLYAIEVVKEPVLAIFDQPENNYNENDRYYLFNILNKLKEDRDSGFLIYTRSRSLIEKWGDALYLLKDGLLSSPVDKHSFLLSWR
ncbi:MAG: ATP-binding cassette domain-containing protein [Deltaproteobacteria bacterium]|jgi:ABC-type lipoprotein export system ATPase subunit|nr:MAG: ATP-binding cassette domain-containing protein [Deltaproteobacteria bacterium]